MQIGMAEPDDASATIEFLNVLYLETDYLLFEAGEVTITAEQQRQQMVTRAKEGTGVILLCLQDMGFQVEGLRRRARRFGDLFVDENTMGRLL